MCTVVILNRPGHPWPLLLAANRDEMTDRPWRPPARHWADRPEIVAGIDEEAGGSWLGVNDHGVVAAILNRRGALGPAPGMRSRGELVLEALDHADARDAGAALAHLEAANYRPFNMVIADNRSALWLTNRDGGQVAVDAIPEGLHMITAWDLDDADSPRIARFLPQFRAADIPDPAAGDWSGWIPLLSARNGIDDETREGAMNIVTDFGFGTMSSSLIALAAPAVKPVKPIWLFAAGRPDEADYLPVAI